MKAFYYLIISLVVFLSACSSDSGDIAYSDAVDDLSSGTSVFANVPVTGIDAPSSFVYGETYTIDFEYTLPNGCYYYESLDYSVVNNTEIILAVEVYVDLVSACTQAEEQGKNSFIITINEKQDYKFKLWKGVNSNGEDVFEEIVVPVVD